MAGRGTRATATDFNNIRTIAANVQGTGSGDAGYGQTLLSTAGVPGSVIASALWNNLRTDMSRARVHQTNTPVEDGTANDGQTLKSITSTTTITEALRFQYATFASQINTDRLTAAGGQLSTGIALATASRTNDWGRSDPEVSHIVRVTFAGYGSVSPADHMRVFFNAGGRINFNASRAGGPTHAKNTSWTDMLSAITSVSFRRTATLVTGTIYSPGAVGPMTSGFGGLTSTYQTFFTQASNVSAYNVNRWVIQARISDVDQLEFKVRFFDYDPDGATNDTVGGTLISEVTCARPSGSNVSVPAPTATTTSLS
jgi:hypothetical protein